jgi:hypothetical protein
MSAQTRTQDKGGKPAGIEDKALAPAVEDKAVEPAPAVETEAPAQPELVDPTDITLAAHYEYRGEHYNPGAQIVVDGETAYGLIGGGFATAGHAEQS